jgi:dipeptidyl aminopeptidase/acylaminoacyl peptidase
MMLSKGDIPESKSGRNYLDQALGTDLQSIRQRSPINSLDKLKAPLLIVHGAKDRRVPIDQAEALRSRLDVLGKEYEWLVKSGEGHGFYDKENRVELFETMLNFLDQNL